MKVAPIYTWGVRMLVRSPAGDVSSKDVFARAEDFLHATMRAGAIARAEPMDAEVVAVWRTDQIEAKAKRTTTRR